MFFLLYNAQQCWTFKFSEIVESDSGTEVPVVNPSESRKTNSVTVFIIIYMIKDPVENQSVVLCANLFCV